MAATSGQHVGRDVGQHIARLREAAGLSQRDLSKKSKKIAGAKGVSPTYIAKLETGLVASPGLDALTSIARALDFVSAGNMLVATPGPPRASIAERLKEAMDEQSPVRQFSRDHENIEAARSQASGEARGPTRVAESSHAGYRVSDAAEERLRAIVRDELRQHYERQAQELAG